MNPVITHDTSYVATGLSHLIEQFKGKPRLEALLTAHMEQLQAIEDALWDILILRALDNPDTSGAQLDQIGVIVGEPRNGLDDLNYRSFLRARIFTNNSDGRIETLLAIVELITDIDTGIKAREFYPKSIEIEADNVTVNARLLFYSFLEKAKAPGTNLAFIYSKSPAANTLKFTSSYSSLTMTTSQRMGSSYTSGIGGGVFAGVFGGA